eukprot:TRINITY_DN27725_c0_g1_i1.p1 TRINITY_DN27725_c0_g1~~TRINITY_DN27725_c0_g1_i1.p1  ORF type:complete len:652 (+),score=57.25 TRINITY_DN27725_c0_g1_i1:164-2119(+)
MRLLAFLVLCLIEVGAQLYTTYSYYTRIVNVGTWYSPTANLISSENMLCDNIDFWMSDMKCDGQLLPQPDFYTIRMLGRMYIEKSGYYEFMVDHDDGVRLVIDSQMLVDNASSDRFNPPRVTIFLKAGVHSIDIDYLEQAAAARLRLSWNETGTMDIVPPSTFIIPSFTQTSTASLTSSFSETMSLPTASPTDTGSTTLSLPTVTNTYSETVVVPPKTVTHTLEQPPAVPINITTTAVPIDDNVTVTVIVESQAPPVAASPSPTYDVFEDLNNLREAANNTPITGTTDTVAAIVSLGSVIGSASMAAQGGILVVVAGSCIVSGDPKEFPLLLHPTGIVVRDSLPLGVVAGNLGIFLTVAILSFILLTVLKKLGVASSSDVQGLLRFPSVFLVVFLMLYQGTALAGFILVVEANDVFQTVFGSATLLICVTTPLILCNKVYHDIPRHARYRILPSRTFVTRFFLGPGEWLSRYSSHHWIQRWGALMRVYNQRHCWWFVIEFYSMFAFASINSIPVTSLVACGHVKLFSLVLTIMLWFLDICCLPRCRPRDTAVYLIGSTCQIVILTMQVIGYYLRDPDHSSFYVATGFLKVSLVIFATKLVLDLSLEVWIIASGRRRTLQRNEWLSNRDTDPDGMGLAILEPSFKKSSNFDV